MNPLLSDQQKEFILNANAKINLAHGSVRAGKTIGTIFSFMFKVEECPDSQIWAIGHTATTIYNNFIRLLMEPRPAGHPDPLSIFRPFCTWNKVDRKLMYKDKTISTVGAKDSSAAGAIQGATMSLCYCDEMTLYPENVLEMISTRISNTYSVLIATMNPSHPGHMLKKWIDKARSGDKNYYELHFTLEKNPYVDDNFKKRIKDSLSGVYFKRFYLGEWTLAEGAIFDFFDRSIYCLPRPPRAADYWIVGVDYGTNNAFAAVLVGVSTGVNIQSDPILWVEKEYYWDHKEKGRQKTSSEFADDLKNFIGPYSVRNIYIDPSAANFRLDLQRRGLHPVNASNDVDNGIACLSSELKRGALFIMNDCPNLIREIEGYVWDPKSCEKGYDEPLKKDDHAIDALRYAIATHKVSKYQQDDGKTLGSSYMQSRYYMNGMQDRRGF